VNLQLAVMTKAVSVKDTKHGIRPLEELKLLNYIAGD
jgi:hypothetical protein